MKKKIIALGMFLAVLLTTGLVPVSAKTATSVTYQTHVQTYGWQKYVKDGATSGTSGQAKRLEGIRIKLTQKEYRGSIQYRTHIQTYGWEKNWKSNGAMSGTSGQAKRLEAIQIRLTGDMAKKYDVYYRVHAQTYGWLGWTKNGAMAGTAGYAKRLEAIQIKLVKKGATAPSEKGDAYKDKNHTKHSYTKKIEHKDSTCKTKGYDIYQCSVCGKTTKKELALSKSHSYKLIKTKQPSCNAAGEQQYQCKNCGKIYKKKFGEATGHKYVVTEEVKPTCTEDGYTTYKCKKCSTSYKETSKKLGHDYSKLEDKKEPTCTAKGYEIYRCTRCDETKKTELEKLDHNYELKDTVDATCTKDGYKEYQCKTCGNTYKDSIPKLEHQYVLISHQDSTCVSKGYDQYQCENCGDIKTTELELDPSKHNYVKTSEDLEYAYYTCSDCGDTKTEYNDKEYTIDLGNGQTTTVVGHFDLEMRQQIYELVCEKREIYGSNPISLVGLDTTLQDVANIRAYEITHTYAHTRPNGERAIRSFYSYACTEGENLAKGFDSAESVCDAWFSSSTHVKNIVSNNFASIGIGVFCEKVNGGYINYFSQMFSPKDNY